MLEAKLTYSTPDGLQEIAIDAERTSFGRGDEVDHHIDDDGLSRLHATVYREGDRLWIVDENSTNGTLVNGARVAASGTQLNHGDIIRIGNHTNLRVAMNESRVVAAAPPVAVNVPPSGVSSAAPSSFSILPVALIAGAVFIISVATVVIGFAVFGSGNTEIVRTTDDEADEDRPSGNDVKVSPTPSTKGSPNATPSTVDNSGPILTDPGNSGPQVNLPASKKYSEMSDAERRQYVEAKAMRVAQIIGNNSSDKMPPDAISKIKRDVDQYFARRNSKQTNGCPSRAPWGDNLQATFERASKNAPFILRAFNEKGMDPRIGLYLAMIESEHCVCLQSSTGPLGMFQFTYATAKLHFAPSDGVVKGASPSNPDVRCQPEPAARAAASYMKALTGRYGTGPSSVPLAIGSYNSGEGGLSSNLEKALSSGQGLPRDFWTLIARGEILSKQFQSENFKYVPKFFAAAIIGENPQDFGLNLQPVSTYSK
jgi:pSer/pThr/pTyr-binding forkhead associated (FHA) protein